MMNVPITYTYYRKLYLSNLTYTFRTGPVSGDDYYSVDTYMYLYKIDDPQNYSWYNDDYSGMGRHSRIDVSLPAGEYYLVIRAYSGYYASTYLGRQGLVNVYQNAALLNSNAPISGYMFDASASMLNYINHPQINFFTAYSTGIPLIWLRDNSDSKMKYRGATYWYSNPSDFYWFDDARIVTNVRKSPLLSVYQYSMLVSAEGAMSFYFGNCDAYGSVSVCDPVNAFGTFFPNLKIADAMISAPKNEVYNCTAWAGGITHGWFWGSLYENGNSGSSIGLNYGNPYVWKTWDDYFGNTSGTAQNPIYTPRYSGATTYVRDQAHSGNAEIAMWSTTNSISNVTHASARLAANKHPHGYDWESKAGANYRIFHPKNSLENFNKSYFYDAWGQLVYDYVGYGGIFAYYRDVSKDPYSFSIYKSASSEQTNSDRNNLLAIRSSKSNSTEPVFTMEQSIEKGLTVIEDVQLETDQMNLVKSKSANLRSSELQKLYNNWIDKIKSPELSLYSNPYKFIETEEGLKFLEYAKKDLKKSIIFFADVIFSNNDTSFEKIIAEILFCEIARDSYAPVIEKIKEEWSNNSYDKLGRYMAPMPETFVKKYIKKLLDKEILKKEDVADDTKDTNGKAVDNHNLVHISPNPVSIDASVYLDLPEKSRLSIKIYSQTSLLVSTVVSNKAYEIGKHSVMLPTSKLNQGIYVCVIEINGTVYSRKFLKD